MPNTSVWYTNQEPEAYLHRFPADQNTNSCTYWHCELKHIVHLSSCGISYMKWWLSLTQRLHSLSSLLHSMDGNHWQKLQFQGAWFSLPDSVMFSVWALITRAQCSGLDKCGWQCGYFSRRINTKEIPNNITMEWWYQKISGDAWKELIARAETQ